MWFRPTPLLLASLILAPLASGQQCPVRAPVQINGSSESRIIDAKISPDGQLVAYMNYGSSFLDLVYRNSDGTSATSTPVMSAPANPVNYFPTFTWQNLYYGGTDKPSVFYTVRISPLSSTGYWIRAHDVASGGNTARATFATASDVRLQRNPFKNIYSGVAVTGTPATFDLFWHDGSWATNPTVIVSSPSILVALDVDPTEQWILYSKRVPIGGGFGWELWRSDRGGNQDLIIDATVQPATQLSDGAFHDNGANAYFAYQAPSNTSYTAARFSDGSPSPSFVDLTNNAFESFDYLSITPSHLQQTPKNKTWLVAAGSHQLATTAQARLSLLPVAGGGEVLMVRGYPYVDMRQPTVDRSASRVTFLSRTNPPNGDFDLFTTQTDRELVASPQALLGSSFKISMPSAVGEFCGLFVSLGTTAAVPFPPLCGFAELAQPAQTLFFANGNGGTLGALVTLPEDPALRGLPLFYQGMRLTATAGDITRLVRVRLF